MHEVEFGDPRLRRHEIRARGIGSRGDEFEDRLLCRAVIPRRELTRLLRWSGRAKGRYRDREHCQGREQNTTVDAGAILARLHITLPLLLPRLQKKRGPRCPMQGMNSAADLSEFDD